MINISNSEWSVLFKQLSNSIGYLKANKIINEHKKILSDFKEKLKIKKEKEIEKYRKCLKIKFGKDIKNKILKFEDEQDEKLNEKFKEEFYKISQGLEGMR